MRGKMVIKYAPSVIALEAPIASDKPLKVDTKRMTAKGLLATEARDRQGDILDVAGLDTSDHERNPVVLLDHGKYYPLPIGVTRTPEGLYTVEVDPVAGEVWQTTHFSQKSQVAEQVFALIAEGVMRGNSIGFRMVEADHLQPDMERGFQRNKDGDAGKLIKRSELVECSWCGVPVNPEAARAAVGKSWCGKSLADPIRNAFRRYLPTGKAVVRSGWDATEKAMLDWHRAANHLVEKSQGITFSHDYLLWSAKAGFEYIIKAEEASDETAEEAGEDPDEVVSDDADAIDPEVIAELLYGLYGDKALEMIRAVYEENEQEEEPSSEVQKAFWTYLQKAWNAADHPRGKGGRFIAKGSGEAVNAAQQVISDVIGGKSTASPKDVMDHLSILTVKQIRELGQKHGKKIPKMLRAELVDAVQQLIDGKPKEAAPEPKPAPTKPEAEPTAGIPSTPKKGVAYNVPTDHLSVDPSRFQYKLNTDASGVTAELKSVKQFNPDFAGVISVWKDPADGKTYVVNGHHRTELARRLGHPDLAVRYIEAGDSKEARAIGALINIAEGRGTAIDAAKFMRDAGAGPEELEARGVSLRGKVAADAAVLTSLSDRLFQRLSTGLLDENKAIAVAKHLKDHDLQNSLVDMLDKREEEGKDLPMRVVEEMAKEMAMTPTTTKREASLFGDLESTESLFVPRNEIKSHVRMEFARELGDFAAGSSKRRAEVLAKFGNLLDVDTNKTLAEQAEQVKNVFDTLVNRKGAISDSINQLASEYVNAKTRRERDAIKDRATEAVREAIQQELASGSIGGQQVDTGATGPAGQPGQGNAEGSAAQALSAQPGGGDSQPAGLTPPDDPRIQDALNRYDGRDQTPGTGGGLFGGDDIRSRDLIDKLPDGAKVVMTEGSMRGKVGSLHREESLDGSSRLVWRPEGSDESFQVYPASLEPLEAHQSWRTEAGAGGRNQNDMFAGTFKPSKMADDDFTPTPSESNFPTETKYEPGKQVSWTIEAGGRTHEMSGTVRRVNDDGSVYVVTDEGSGKTFSTNEVGKLSQKDGNKSPYKFAFSGEDQGWGMLANVAQEQSQKTNIGKVALSLRSEWERDNIKMSNEALKIIQSGTPDEIWSMVHGAASKLPQNESVTGGMVRQAVQQWIKENRPDIYPPDEPAAAPQDAKNESSSESDHPGDISDYLDPTKYDTREAYVAAEYTRLKKIFAAQDPSSRPDDDILEGQARMWADERWTPPPIEGKYSVGDTVEVDGDLYSFRGYHRNERDGKVYATVAGRGGQFSIDPEKLKHGGIKIIADKVPHNTTLAEFRKQAKDGFSNRDKPTPNEWRSLKEAHKNHVANALREGKTVPDEVLADYPDLAKEYGRQPTPPDEPAAAAQPKAASTTTHNTGIKGLDDDLNKISNPEEKIRYLNDNMPSIHGQVFRRGYLRDGMSESGVRETIASIIDGMNSAQAGAALNAIGYPSAAKAFKGEKRKEHLKELLITRWSMMTRQFQ